MIDEGYIKFSLSLVNAPPPVKTGSLEELNRVRTRLFDKNLIGITPEGIGFGNVSIRTNTTFVISGTATGDKRILEADDYSEVTDFNIETNSVTCKGTIRASSESMSHGALYRADRSIMAVIHIHSSRIFTHMLEGEYVSTSPDTAYGTPAMAFELLDRAQTITGPEKLIVMAGHEEGVIACASSIQKTYELIEAVYSEAFLQ